MRREIPGTNGGKKEKLKKKLDEFVLPEDKITHLQKALDAATRWSVAVSKDTADLIEKTLEEYETAFEEIEWGIEARPIEEMLNDFPDEKKRFDERFNSFFDEWKKDTSGEKDLASIKNSVYSVVGFSVFMQLNIIENCRKLIREKAESGESNGKLTQLAADLLYDPIEDIFKLPKLLTAYFRDSSAEWEKTKESLAEHSQQFRGNSLRKRGKLIKYERATKILKCLEERYPYMTGMQKLSCEIAGINASSYSRWINNIVNGNNEQYHKWRNEASEKELDGYEQEIEEYLRNMPMRVN